MIVSGFVEPITKELPLEPTEELILPCAMVESDQLGPWCVDAAVYLVTTSGTLLCRVSLPAVDLTTRYLGLELCSPLVASASPLNGEVSTARLVEEGGAAAIVMPSLFEEEILAAPPVSPVAVSTMAEPVRPLTQWSGSPSRTGSRSAMPWWRPRPTSTWTPPTSRSRTSTSRRTSPTSWPRST